MKTTRFYENILFIIFLTGYSLFASQYQDRIEKANTLFRQSEFENALIEYNSVLESGFESASLYYNIGNTHFRLGHLGKSILNYEKAIKLDPNYEDAHYNLELANARTVDRIKEVPQIFIVEWFDTFIALFNYNGWAALVISLYISFFVFLGFYILLRKNRPRKISFFVSMFLLASLTLTSILFFVKSNKEKNEKFGVLIENVVTVKQSPDENAQDAFVIHEGLKVKVEDNLDSWIKIRLYDGKIGWILKSYLAEI